MWLNPVRRSKVKKKQKEKQADNASGVTPACPAATAARLNLLCMCVFINVPISTGHAAPDQRGRDTMTND